jgi:integrase
MGVCALLLLYCGLWRGELVALTWDDVDIKNKKIKINKVVIFHNNHPVLSSPDPPSRNREIPIPTIIIEIVEKAKNEAKYKLVCPSFKGKMMSRSEMDNAWKSYLQYLNIIANGCDESRSLSKAVMIDNPSPRAFRKTYASLLFNAGVDVKSASAFLGHSSVNSTLDLSVRLVPEKEIDSTDLINIYFDKIFGDIQ